jgi:hypothetical protein
LAQWKADVLAEQAFVMQKGRLPRA